MARPVDFGALTAGFGPPPPVVAAGVSGGPHSLALAVLARDWAARAGIRFLALIVDHGLRPESAAEAAHVRAMLAGQGIAARVLTLALAPGPAMQERAREGRLAALLAACLEEGAAWLMLGHHRLDQAETLLFRAARGSGEAGLAAMPGWRAAPEALVLRPLLGTPPAALEDVCTRAGLPPVRDPSNDNPRFARIRTRAALADPDGEGAVVGALAQAAHALGRRRARRDAALADRAARAVTLLPCGAARVDAAALDAPLLAALLRVVGGARHAPARAEVEALLARGQGTLGGAWWRADGWVLREPSLLEALVPARAGAVWDGRWHLEQDMPGCMLGAAGAGLDGPWPAAVRKGLPALWKDGRLYAVPHIGLGPPVPGLTFRPAGGPLTAVFGVSLELGIHPGQIRPMLGSTSALLPTKE
ncbi:tRNA lysidine(34) synthetase TilS [Rhodovarius crocodyli]|uniref:tRNA(Ile)-lysidine synthase n=1 Tax=Rhodovarius crocodyli TaxID=1979269 RepID=A0A437MD87_9PROT|nr:tRNA lysidine(34) synthetase TilS [Rhodovarius crocodyli]RVT95608.1 tRNA lysidine(34) synthetase TilS [Rhodovarius crocodyli]